MTVIIYFFKYYILFTFKNENNLDLDITLTYWIV